MEKPNMIVVVEDRTAKKTYNNVDHCYPQENVYILNYRGEDGKRIEIVYPLHTLVKITIYEE